MTTLQMTDQEQRVAALRHAAALQLRYDPTSAEVEKGAYRRGAWAVGALARDAKGVEVDYDSPQAVAFCALGAANRAELDLGFGFSDGFDVPISDSVRSPLGLIRMWARTIEAAKTTPCAGPDGARQAGSDKGDSECV